MQRFIAKGFALAFTFHAAMVMAIVLAAAARADVYTWNDDAGGNWSDAGNWTSSSSDFPNSDTADARIQLDITANQTITLTGNIQVNALRFEDTGGGTDMNVIISPSTYTLSFTGAAPTVESKTSANHGLDINAPIDISAAGLIYTGGGVVRFGGGITGGVGDDLTLSAGSIELSGQSPNFSGDIIVQSGTRLQARGFAGSGADVLGNTTGVTIINGDGWFETRDSSGKTISEKFILNGIRTGGSLRCYAGGNNTINGDVILNADSSFSVADWADTSEGVPTGNKRLFYIDSVIQDGVGGPHGVYFLGDLSSANGQGTQGRLSEMILGAVSTYGGDTYVTTNFADDGSGTFSGTLRLGIDNALPTGTKLSIGGAYTTDDGTLGTAAGNGRFVLNGHSQELAGLASNGTGSMNRVVGNSATLSTLTLNVADGETSVYDGYLGWTDTDDNNLALVKKGPGALVLTAANTYTGATTVEQGVLTITNPMALGSSASGSGTTVTATGAALQVEGGITVAEPVTIAGSGVNWSGALQNASGDNTWSGPITISGSSTRIGAASGTLFTLTGGITGDGFSFGSYGGNIRVTTTAIDVGSNSVTVVNSSTLELNVGGNTWGGTTMCYGGTLKLGLDNAMPTTTVVTIGHTNNANGTLDLNGHSQQIAGLTDIVGDTGTRRIMNSAGGTPTLTVNNASAYSYGGVLGAAGGNSFGLTKSGAGTLTLSGDNTYTGPTSVEQGVLLITSATALGDTSSGTTVETEGATLQISGGINVAEPITLGGGSSGTRLQNISGTNTLSGLLTFSGSGARVVASSGTTLNITGGATTSTNPTFVVNAYGTVNITTNPIDLDGGTFYTDSGGLTILAVAGNTFANTTFASGTLRMGVANALPSNTIFRHSGLSYGTGGTLDLNGFDQTVGALYTGPDLSRAAGSKITSATPATFTVNQSSNRTFSGAFTGAVSLVKDDSGTLTLDGDNTHTGDTTVSGGTLALSHASNNNIAASPLVQAGVGATLDVSGLNEGTLALASGQSLGGSGTVVGNVDVLAGAALAPGMSAGTLNLTGDLSFAQGAYFDVDIESLNLADLVQMSGGLLAVDDATIRVDLGFSPELGDSWTILQGESELTGQFNPTVDLLGGLEHLDGWKRFEVSYGNSVVLTVVPEPGTTIAMLGLAGMALLGCLRRRRRS